LKYQLEDKTINYCWIKPWNVLLSFIRLLTDLLIMPWKWHKRLLNISVPKLLVEIEETSKKKGPIRFSSALIIALVKYRVRYSVLWRKSPCLLGGMLLSYFLCRAGFQVKLHLGCKFQKGHLFGHCWISSSQLETVGRFQNQGDMEEIYCKTFNMLDLGKKWQTY
jgi:hypothetical protein